MTYRIGAPAGPYVINILIDRQHFKDEASVREALAENMRKMAITLHETQVIAALQDVKDAYLRTQQSFTSPEAQAEAGQLDWNARRIIWRKLVGRRSVDRSGHFKRYARRRRSRR